MYGDNFIVTDDRSMVPFPKTHVTFMQGVFDMRFPYSHDAAGVWSK